MSTGLVTKIFRDSGRRKCRAKQHFHINKHTYSSSFAPLFFQEKWARSRARSPCRTPQSATTPAAGCKQHNLLCHAEQHFHIKQTNLNIQVLLPLFSFKKRGRGQGRVALVALRRARNPLRRSETIQLPLPCKAAPSQKSNTQIFKFFCPTFLLRKVGEVKGEKPLSPFANGETSLVALRRARHPLKTPYKYSFLKTCKLSSGGKTGKYSKPHAPV